MNHEKSQQAQYRCTKKKQQKINRTNLLKKRAHTHRDTKKIVFQKNNNNKLNSPKREYNVEEQSLRTICIKFRRFFFGKKKT